MPAVRPSSEASLALRGAILRGAWTGGGDYLPPSPFLRSTERIERFNQIQNQQGKTHKENKNDDQ